MALSVWTCFNPLFAFFNQLHSSVSRLSGGVVGVLYSQLALLVSVTGIGGNLSGTGAEGGSRSPEAAPDPKPCGPHADTDPSKVEAPLRRGGEGERSNNKSREDAWGKSTWGNELCKCDLHEAVYVYTWTQCDSSAVVIGGSPYLVPQCLTQTRKTSWLDTRVTNTAQSYFC